MANTVRSAVAAADAAAAMPEVSLDETEGTPSTAVAEGRCYRGGAWGQGVGVRRVPVKHTHPNSPALHPTTTPLHSTLLQHPFTPLTSCTADSALPDWLAQGTEP